MLQTGNSEFTVFIVDDDEAILRALSRLLGACGYGVRTFSSSEAFLAESDPTIPGCAILDVLMPGLDGLRLQAALNDSGIERPVIFITGYGDIPMSVRAMKAGAVEFLTKPFRDQDLLDAVGLALERDRVRRAREERLTELRGRFDTLTARERQVMSLVVAGRLNKQIAGELGVSEMTVKMHRRQVMRKMQATGVAQLVRLADQLGVLTPQKS